MASTALTLSSAPKSKTALLKGYFSSKKALARVKEQTAKTIEGAVQASEVVGAAFAFSALQGATTKVVDGKSDGGIKVPGLNLPVDLAAGIGLHLAAVFGFGGKYNDHLRNFANGAAASYVSSVGRGWGYKMAQKTKAKSATKGDLSDDIASLMSDAA